MTISMTMTMRTSIAIPKMGYQIQGVSILSSCSLAATTTAPLLNMVYHCRPKVVVAGGGGGGPTTTDTDTKDRPLAKFHADIWADHFTSFSLPHSAYDSYSKHVEELKHKVKKLLLDSAHDPIENIIFINTLCRLGVSYHFEKEIEEQLIHTFVDIEQKFTSSYYHHYDLYTTALVFRVLRQHGYKISCDIFNKFRGSNGKFKETLTGDIRGMLSLYEATHLMLHGEDILEEALEFTILHLQSLKYNSTHPLRSQVIHALEQPLHKGLPRLEARRYISFYEQEHQYANNTLLKFAKLDFNKVQLLHRHEIGHISRWWKDLNIASHIRYSRQGHVEAYLWISGAYFEPKYSSARIILNKFLAMVSLLDDTYDAYATFEELQCLTDAIHRWDTSIIDELPNYMKIIFSTLLKVFEDVEKEVIEEGRLYSITYTKEAIKELVMCYLVEAKWSNDNHIPQFNEYMENALASSACNVSVLSSLVGMGEIANKCAFEWIKSKPKCIKSCEEIGRLLNDITGHKVEQKRKHVASAIECYMKQYGGSEEEAVEELQRRITNAWKDLNEECLMPTAISKHILTRILNFARGMDVVYKSEDGYTNSTTVVKDYIKLLFVHPIPIAE